MNAVAIERLIASQDALIASLDSDDAGAIDAATIAMRDALIAIGTTQGWREQPELKDRVTDALRAAEGARARLNFLTDRTRRRIELLDAAAGVAPGQAYRRTGQFA